MAVPRGTWSVERVVAELRRLHAGGDPINRVALLDGGHSTLVSAAERYCGTFGKALKLSGVEVAPTRATWSAKVVVQELRRRHRASESLNSEELRATGHGGLVSAAITYLGNWRKAIAKAGVPAFKRGRWKSWDEVRDELRAAHAKGIKMSTAEMRSHGLAALIDAAKLEAGTWNRALERAGIPLVMTYERWTPSQVLTEIRELDKAGVALSSNVVIAQGHRKLVKAASRHFGSWTAACRRAVRSYRPLLERWTVERVVERIKSRFAAGESVRATDVHQQEPTLTAAARRVGVDWRAACKRAGVPASAIKTRIARTHTLWTAEAVIDRLQQAARSETPLLVKSFPGSFVQSVIRRYGSWPAAMAAAKLSRRYQRDRKAALANRLGGRFLASRPRPAARG